MQILHSLSEIGLVFIAVTGVRSGSRTPRGNEEVRHPAGLAGQQTDMQDYPRLLACAK